MFFACYKSAEVILQPFFIFNIQNTQMSMENIGLIWLYRCNKPKKYSHTITYKGNSRINSILKNKNNMKEIVIKDLQNVIEDIKNENVDGVIDFIKKYNIMDSYNPMCTLVKQMISDKIKDFMVQNNETKLCAHTQHGECNHYDHYKIEENGDLIVSGFSPRPLTDNSLSKAYRGYKYIQKKSNNHENK